MKGIEKLLEIIVERDGVIDTCEELQRDVLKKHGLDCNNVTCSTCQLFTLAWITEHGLDDLVIIKNSIAKYEFDLEAFKDMKFGITCSKYEDFISFKHIMGNMGMNTFRMRDDEWHKDVKYVGSHDLIMAWDEGFREFTMRLGLDPFENLEVIDYKDIDFTGTNL